MSDGDSKRDSTPNCDNTCLYELKTFSSLSKLQKLENSEYLEEDKTPLNNQNNLINVPIDNLPYEKPSEDENITPIECPDAESPEIKKAQKIHFASLKLLKYSICSTKLEDIGNISLNYQMYLSIVKRICCLFLIIGTLSIYPIYYNSQGKNVKLNEAYFEIDLWNLNNQIHSDKNDSQTIDQLMIKNFMAFDFLTILVYLAFLQYLASFIKNLIIKHSERAFKLQKFDESTIDIEDYTIMVLGLPNDIEAEEIASHFGSSEVINVVLVKDYQNGLSIYKKVDQLKSDIFYCDKVIPRLERIFDEAENEKMKKIIKQKIIENQLKNEKLNEKLRSVNEELEHFHTIKGDMNFDYRFPIIRAFVTFSTKSAKNNCLRKYTLFANLLSIINIQHQSLVLKRNKNDQKIRIKVFSADSPISINWEHIKNHVSLILRFIIFITCFLMILGTSYEIVYLVKLKFRDLINTEDCSEIEKSDLTLSAAQNEYTKPEEINCYYKGELYSKMKINKELRDFCTEFIEEMTKIVAIRFALGIIIWLVNFGMKKGVKFLIETIYHSGKNKGELLIMTCLFPLVVVNMGVVTVVLNVNEKVFTKDWFSTSGSTLVSAMLIGTLTSHLEYIISFLIRYFKRNFFVGNCISQKEMNNLFKGPEFELANRYALILIVVCICYMHAGGLPILNAICCLSLFVQYWVDKWLMFGHNSTPTISNKFIGYRILLLLHFPLLIHCIELFFIYNSTLGIDKVNTQDSFKLPLLVSVVTSIVTAISLLWHFFDIKLCQCKKNSINIEDKNHISLDNLRYLAKQYDITENHLYARFINDIKYRNRINSESLGSFN